VAMMTAHPACDKRSGRAFIERSFVRLVRRRGA
jgi:hypothetical protein